MTHASKGDTLAVMVASNMLTRADLDVLPDDNLRHELIDGQFVMTPAPGIPHQTMVGSIYAALRELVRGSDLRVLAAPVDVALGSHVVEPDVLVARRDDFSERELPVAPLLVAEVLSPSTSHLDTGRKRDLHAEAGVPSYWLVDPAGPSVAILVLVGGDDASDADGVDAGTRHYIETARAVGREHVTVEQPVTMTFSPADLLLD